jgi:predicted phosphodiesterase
MTCRFAVFGDTHNRAALAMPQIDAINQLKPDLVVHLGDQIMGGLPGEWNDADSLLRQLQPPVVTVAGNHDIFDSRSRSVYEERYGPAFRSFTRHGVHFVILDSELRDEHDKLILRIDDKQLDWLDRSLAGSDGVDARVVCLHRPLWSDSGPMAVAESAAWMTHVHPVLVRHGVCAVFAGHVHRYMKFGPVDGVHYYITGASTTTRGDEEALGDFIHFCMVTVSDQRCHVDVIRPSGIVSDRIVYYEHVETPAILESIKAKLALADGENPGSIELTITNAVNKPIEVSARPLSVPNSQWRIAPQLPCTSLAAGATGRLILQATIDDLQDQYPAPQIMVTVTGAEPAPVTTQISVPVEAFRSVLCPKTARPPGIDGKPDDLTWQGASTLAAFYNVTARNRTSCPTEVQLLYDHENLYLGIRCHEPHLSGLTAGAGYTPRFWFDDLMEILIDPRIDGQGYYHLAFNARAVTYSAHLKGPPDGGQWRPECTVQAGRHDQAWTLDISLAWASLGQSCVRPGAQLGLQVVRNRVQPLAECSQWSPTFGGNHVPEKFGTLILE